MTLELHRKHRPIDFKSVIGQPEAVRQLREFARNGGFPHAMLFTGPSGCGKTTLARIMQSKLDCSDMDFAEVNCADFRGIDMVREIRNRMNLMPIDGKTRVWLIDEAHKLSSDAQNAFLKILEDPPGHVYFILATTDSDKLITTVRTRCTEIKVKAFSPAGLKDVVSAVLGKEQKKLGEEVLDKLVEHGEGSARKVLVLLNAVIGYDNEEEQLRAIQASDTRAKGIELARAFLAGAPWSDVAALLKEIEEDPESLRHMVMCYMSNVVLGGGKKAARAHRILDVFCSNPFYDSKKAGLVAASYAVTHNL